MMFATLDYEGCCEKNKTEEIATKCAANHPWHVGTRRRVARTTRRVCPAPRQVGGYAANVWDGCEHVRHRERPGALLDAGTAASLQPPRSAHPSSSPKCAAHPRRVYPLALGGALPTRASRHRRAITRARSAITWCSRRSACRSHAEHAQLRCSRTRALEAHARAHHKLPRRHVLGERSSSRLVGRRLQVRTEGPANTPEWQAADAKRKAEKEDTKQKKEAEDAAVKAAEEKKKKKKKAKRKGSKKAKEEL
eukprot:3034607-Prymnesium_polylepis.1